MAFERALSDTIARRIPVNESSSKKETAPTHSDDVPAGVLAGDQDAAGADQRQSSEKYEENATADGLQDQATSSVDAVDEYDYSSSTEVFESNTGGSIGP